MSTTNRDPYIPIICILGAPGSGKSTLSTHLSQAYNLTHLSIGAHLRDITLTQPSHPLHALITRCLSTQTFLPLPLLTSLLSTLITRTLTSHPHTAGILLDGFPRTAEQTAGFPLRAKDGRLVSGVRPDLVVWVCVERGVARERFLRRAREGGDTVERFGDRWGEFETRTEEVRRGWMGVDGLVVEVDANGDLDVTIAKMERALAGSERWVSMFGTGVS